MAISCATIIIILAPGSEPTVNASCTGLTLLQLQDRLCLMKYVEADREKKQKKG